MNPARRREMVDREHPSLPMVYFFLSPRCLLENLHQSSN